jgi:hypothetical protein
MSTTGKTTIRNFAYAALLAMTTMSFMPTLASADTARGRFTLAHDVRWAGNEVPAGEYDYSFDAESLAPVLTLSQVGGARKGFLLLVTTTETTKPSEASLLVLEGSYVSAMQLPEIGRTLEFPVPRRAVIARAATSASAPGQ